MTTTPVFGRDGALYWLLASEQTRFLWTRADLPVLHMLGQMRMHLMAEAVRHADFGGEAFINQSLDDYKDWWFNQDLWIPGVYEAISTLWILENQILAGGGK